MYNIYLYKKLVNFMGYITLWWIYQYISFIYRCISKKKSYQAKWYNYNVISIWIMPLYLPGFIRQYSLYRYNNRDQFISLTLFSNCIGLWYTLYYKITKVLWINVCNLRYYCYKTHINTRKIEKNNEISIKDLKSL